MAAGARGHGHLRAACADREQVIGTLKAAFVQGRLTKDELDARVDRAFASRTYADLAALTADLPVGLAADQPSRMPGEQPVLPPGRVLAVATALYAGVWMYAPLSPQASDNRVAGALVFLGGLVYLGILLICVAAILASRRDKRSGSQPPRRPGARGQASRRLPPAGPGGQLPPAGHGHRSASDAGRSRRPGQRRPGSWPGASAAGYGAR